MSTPDTHQDAPQDAQQLETALAAVALWHGESSLLAAAGYSANHVFSFDASGERFFLRLTSARDRTRTQIAAELDFIIYLRRGGASVSVPVESARGRLIETVERAGR
ncbi:MAG TPA: hypothetical protein VNA19_03390, partial [Pyrinomonadaceae bacterium]|nr:hypothetical protein [Pyrinomonadaceae bacterium]